MGRVNYGHKLSCDSQHKGIRTESCVDCTAFIGSSTTGFTRSQSTRFFKRNGRQVLQHFTRMIFSWTTLDTYLDDRIWEKGVVFVLAITLALLGSRTDHFRYVPHGFLKKEPISKSSLRQERYQEH